MENYHTMRTPLTVYKASAGSGKTFTLAIEYIKLLINNPTSYRNTLAVTFTNKATEEMKMRILSQLYGIWKMLPDSDNYTEKITNELNVSREFASERAGQALSFLIHDYSNFKVETIDAFFQSVLRNLAKELELTANLKIGLNDKQVEEQAVDRLIENLHATSKVLLWIISYIQKNVDEEKSWNVIHDIKRFGLNIFKDIYKSHRQELNDSSLNENLFKELNEELSQIQKGAINIINQYVEKFFDTLSEYGLQVEDFSNGKSGVCGYFLKLRNGVYQEEELLKTRVVSAMEDSSKWAKKADWKPGKPIYEAVNNTLHQLLLDTERMRKKQYLMFKSAELTQKHMYELRLLNYIDNEVRNLNKENNRFLLSDTQSLLHDLINDSDTSFIFEKTGTQIENIMIDEFQDTSLIQWKNFKVLMNECMSREHSQNLIVGDVKQSIYRWRDGDWRLLNNIDQQFRKDQITEEPLKTNYRSCRNIIEFNNAFFQEAVKIACQTEELTPEESKQLEKAYEDVEQRVPQDRPQEGIVEIQLLPKESYREETMRLLSERIMELIELGVSFNKMAILVRSNSSIEYIAQYFMENHPEIKMVSDEAFRLDASLSVNMIINALRIIAHPEDVLSKSLLVKAYQTHIKQTPLTDSDLFVDIEDMNKYLPHEFVDSMDSLANLPIIDLVEKLFRIFELSVLNDQSAYMCAFYDQLNKYLIESMSDIDSFLREWDEDLHEKYVHSDQINGIRLITIHKSKGLEFDHVFMPFCDWKLEKKSVLWCTPPQDASPYNKLPLIPIDFVKSSMKDTIFWPDYQQEHFQNTVDNLNLLYVAFTRAKKSLFVYGKRNENAIRSYLIEQTLSPMSEKLQNSLYDDANDNKEASILFSFGTLTTNTKEEEKEDSKNVFNQPTYPREILINSYEEKVKFYQSNKSKSFVTQDPETEKQNGYILMGNILHNIFSTIQTADDIEPALQLLEQEGVLYNKEITKEKLKAMLTKRLNDKRVSEWFSNKWTILNECTILTYDNDENKVTEHRPDRVMTDGNEVIVVDFKFGKPISEHQDQVRRYMSLLTEMGYTNIKGYLWYVYSNLINEVK